MPRHLVGLVLFALLPAAARADGLERLKYNHPGLVVDLGVGLWAWPLPMDFDGDGDLDLVVSCPDKPYNGVYFFENPGGDTAGCPVFKPGRRIGQGLQNVQRQLRRRHAARPARPGVEYPDFLKTGLARRRSSCRLPAERPPEQGPRQLVAVRRLRRRRRARPDRRRRRLDRLRLGRRLRRRTATGPAGRCAASSTCSATRGTTDAPTYDDAGEGRGRRQADRRLRHAVAQLRRLRRRRRPRPDLRRVPRRVHLLREHRHADRARVCRRAAGSTTADGEPVAMDLEMITPDGDRLGRRRRPRPDRRRRGRPRRAGREHRARSRRPARPVPGPASTSGRRPTT